MTDVFFRPWVGANYKANGFNGNHILVLGESCYCGECECGFDEESAEWEECRNKIPDVVNGFLSYTKGDDSDWSMRTYRRFTDIFMGHKCTPEETKMFWNSFVLYNYVQVALKRPGDRPKPQQWETGEKPFFEVLAEYNPDVIIAWGKQLWDNMPKTSLIDNSFLNRWGDGLRYYNNGKRDIPAYACYHPSRWFSDEDTDYFKRLLEKVSAL